MKHSLASLLLLGVTLLPASPVCAANTILHHFAGGAADGSHPSGSLTRSGSKLYGMTGQGGGTGTGTIFSMDADGTGFALLHSFTGAQPSDFLTLSGSKLYGTTSDGGTGDGSIFSMNTDGTGFALLHAFAGSSGDGRDPLRLIDPLRLETLWHGERRRCFQQWRHLQHWH